MSFLFGVIAQFGRASDLHSEGPEFESLWLHENVKSGRLDEKSIAKETKGQPKVLHFILRSRVIRSGKGISIRIGR